MDFSKEEPNLPSDSDDSDEDYVPSGAESNPPSEVESEGVDGNNSDSGEEETSSPKKRKRTQNASKKKARKKDRKASPSDEEETERTDDDDDDKDKKVLTEEEEKKHADSLWADFMSDTKISKPVHKKSTIANKAEEKDDNISNNKEEPKKEEKENKVTVTQVFEFAGEEVKVTKEVSLASKEAQIAQGASRTPVVPGSSGPPAGRGRGRTGGGLSAVLGQIGKKSKLGTLEKSKLDWDRFKKDEGIEDELRNFNRGKDGYLEKQDFLQRADLRQFEIEKGLRATRRSNR